MALLRADPSDDGEDEADRWWGAHTCVSGEPGPGVAASDLEPAPAPAPAPAPVAVPVPGRHAARRAVPTAPRLPAVPETLRGRVRLGPAQLAVVALALVAALALTCWWLARGRATALTAPVAASSAAPLVSITTPATAPVVEAGAPTSGAEPAAAATTGASADAMVTVDVEGKVRRPGIVMLPTGSRVTDALKAAGGVPHRRVLHGLNLAAVLVDGQQIVVGAAAPTGGAAVAETAGSGSIPTAGEATAPVNLNTATADQLDTLPDVGPVTAQSILEWREQNGGFTSVQELLEVDGIGPATLAKLAPHVTV